MVFSHATGASYFPRSRPLPAQRPHRQRGTPLIYEPAQALVAALPPVAHETGKAVQQRVERDHQHLKGRLRPTRGFKTLAGARTLCRGHAFLRNLRSGFYDLGRLGAATIAPQPPVMQAWAALTGTLLGR